MADWEENCEIVSQSMPDYQEKINWLSVNGKVLIGSDKITSEPQYQRHNN